MSFAGYFHVRFVLSTFLPVCFDLFSPTVLVPGLFWCNSIYLVTTAGFVADPRIMSDKEQQQRVRSPCLGDANKVWMRSDSSFKRPVRLCVILPFCFYLSSSCDIGESDMSSAPLLFLGS